ncbi:hypothetical protein DMC25_08690 [Caulobacter sp. D4A]|uniref:hypothetical protein n=1 Tax=unclassified Caulobacter TaxID=2648921 RepID=UPI000D72C502|nr:MULTISPECIES: hypothetical protein [unclassified Caulobacter]PXA89755.1 hypothetical protein DMC18_16205 [Caulobacter sp. D5]PXA89927.1 hypothetical protein DMC25_08690 [Caulobacter sp. D4A]
MRIFSGAPIAAALLLAATAMAAPSSALAVTQCQGQVLRIFAGDGGHIYIFLKTSAGEGPAGVLTPSDPNRDAILSMAMTAQAQKRDVIMRFTADGLSCTTVTARFDFVGMYLEP